MAAVTPTPATLPLSDRTGNSFPMLQRKNADGNYSPVVAFGGSLPCYRYVIQAFAMVATPTAAVIIKGSDSINGRVKSIELLGGATAYGEMAVRLDRWSDAGTIGSAALSAAIAAAKHDTKNVAPNINVYTVGTANWTTRGTLTSLDADRVPFVPLTTAATSSDGKPVLFGGCAARGSQDFVLRGASDWLVVDFLGTAIPSGGVLDCVIEIEEDAYL